MATSERTDRRIEGWQRWFDAADSLRSRGADVLVAAVQAMGTIVCSRDEPPSP